MKEQDLSAAVAATAPIGNWNNICSPLYILKNEFWFVFLKKHLFILFKKACAREDFHLMAKLVNRPPSLPKLELNSIQRLLNFISKCLFFLKKIHSLKFVFF